MTLLADIESKKQLATAWFKSFRDQLCASLEAVEADVTGPHADRSAGKFEIEPWSREAGGGGEMGLLHGRVFEKAGVHISTVHGHFSEEFARQMPHTEAGADLRVRIPMRQDMRSLNVAVAGSLVLGEALRQTNGFAALT